MANSHGAGELTHVAGSEDIPDQSVVLPQVQLALVACYYPRCVLSPVLEHGKTVIKRQIYIGFTNYTDYTAHGFRPALVNTTMFALNEDSRLSR